MNFRQRKQLRLESLESRKMFAVAAGDFNGDGRDDMAYAVPGEDVTPFLSPTQVDAGAVNVIYGSNSYTGLKTTGNELITQGAMASKDDHFGTALAAGDFNGDGYDDLAVGIPNEDVSGVANAGAVAILYGSSQGLRPDSGIVNLFWSPELWHQGKLQGGLEANDRFGETLAVGDFDNDGFDDLAVGVPEEDLGFFNIKQGAGAVNVIRGSATGLTASGNQIWHQDSVNVDDVAESGDHFGKALTTGDFNNDGYDDLAVGVPDEDIGAIADAGAVNVLYGASGSGLTAAIDQFWSQNSYVNGAVEDLAEAYDRFGSALAAGDFDNDGRDDLAIGVPGENIGSVLDAGAVNVLYGRSSQTGLSGLWDQLWHQDSPSIQGVAEQGDEFGFALAAGDFDNNGYDDLAIGAPGESVYPAVVPPEGEFYFPPENGSVNVIYGRSGFIFSGLMSTNNQLWHQNSTGILDSAGGFDRFGQELVVGNFNNDGRADLAISVPAEHFGSSLGYQRAAHVIYGRSNTSGLTADGDQFWHQNASDVYGQVADTIEWSDGFYVEPPK